MWGLVTAVPVIYPPSIVAVPIATISVPVTLSCGIETLPVWIQDLYPEPVLPILIDLTVPEQPTIAVPPAEING